VAPALRGPRRRGALASVKGLAMDRQRPPYLEHALMLAVTAGLALAAWRPASPPLPSIPSPAANPASASPAQAPAAPRPTPQGPRLEGLERLAGLERLIGEVLEFEFGWQAPGAVTRLVAAQGSATVLPGEEQGRPALLIQGRASSVGLVQAMWPMRDSVESVVDRETGLVLRQTLEQRESGSHTKQTIAFAPDGKSGSRWRIRYHKPPDFPGRETTDQAPCHGRLDAASLGPYLRLAGASQDEGETRAVFFDGKNSFRIIVRVEAREKITVKAGTFDALRCEVKFEDIDRSEKQRQQPDKVKKATMWVSASPLRIPLRLESDTFVGKVYGELVKRTPGEGG